MTTVQRGVLDACHDHEDGPTYISDFFSRGSETVEVARNSRDSERHPLLPDVRALHHLYFFSALVLPVCADTEVEEPGCVGWRNKLANVFGCCKSKGLQRDQLLTCI